jgi:hypothetical protein
MFIIIKLLVEVLYHIFDFNSFVGIKYSNSAWKSGRGFQTREIFYCFTGEGGHISIILLLLTSCGTGYKILDYQDERKLYGVVTNTSFINAKSLVLKVAIL